MFVKLDENRTAQIIVKFGEYKEPHRTTTIQLKISLVNDKLNHRTIWATCNCSPKDNFSRFEGRKYAMRKLFNTASYLSKEDKRILAPAILYGKIKI